MSIKVECTVPIVDMRHNAPRLMTVSNHHEDSPGGPWIEINIDNVLYRVKSKDLTDAIRSSEV